MKDASKVIMGGTLILVVSLAIIFGLVLVLLAELYCSLLLRRRQLRSSTANITTFHPAATANDASNGYRQYQDHSGGTPSLSSFYAQGVLRAPRSFLFPSVNYDNEKVDVEKQHSHLHQFCESQNQQPSSTHHCIGHIFSVPPSPPFLPLASPKLVHEDSRGCSTSAYNDEVCGGSSSENYIYICNPIYENDADRPGRVDTPFQTPDSSPSRLETMDSCEEDVVQSQTSSPSSGLPMTPPLTPMKKLPAEASSVSLRDARSLAISGSESNSNNDGISSSSSSSGSPCTSPSW